MESRNNDTNMNELMKLTQSYQSTVKTYNTTVSKCIDLLRYLSITPSSTNTNNLYTTLCEMMNQIHRNHRTYNMNMGFIFECYRNLRFRGGEPLGNIARENGNTVNSPTPDTILTYTIYPTTNISDSPSTSELLSEEEIFQSTSSRVFHSGEENITCPINLEIIADGESITTIQHCGRVFKT